MKNPPETALFSQIRGIVLFYNSITSRLNR